MARVTQLKSAGRQRPRRLQGIEFLSRRPGPFDPGRREYENDPSTGMGGGTGSGVPRQSGGTSGDLSIPGYVPETPVTAPYQPTGPSPSFVGRRSSRPSLASLINPPALPLTGPQPGDVDPLEQLLTGVGQAAADPLSTALAALGGAGAKKPPSTPKPDPIAGELEQLMRQAQKETRTIHHLDGKTWVDPPKSRAELAPHVEALYYSSRGKYGNKLPKLLDGQGRPLGTGGRPVANPTDPLGDKTLGAVSTQELAQAQGQGTLKIGPNGTLSTQSGRQALRQLKSARQRVAASTGITTGLGPNADAFADALADYGNYDPQGIGAWVKSEGGAYEAGGAAGPQNWLGIGYPGHQEPFADSPYFSGTPRRAGRAAGEWIEGRIGDDYNYEAAPSLQTAIQGAKGGSAQDLIEGLAASGWGTNVSHVQQNLAGVQVQHDPQAVQALQVAKQNARAEGINPTPFNGDVAGGGGDFTWVRADAKGMVDWTESALGTQEGSPKAERWGARFGLNTVSQPWCANFVSNGLLRRGITDLPSNPNYVPTYEEEWGKYAVAGGLEKAKPGDLLTFSGRHIGVYVGNGEMISGNSSDSVSRTGIDSDLSMVIRPPYKGGKVKVADAQLAGSSPGTALAAPGEGVAVGSDGGTQGIGAAEALPPELTQLTAPLSAAPTFAGVPDVETESPEAELLRLLTEPGLRRRA